MTATDRGSRNGSFVNGRRVPPVGVMVPLPAVFRIGYTVGVVVKDITPYETEAFPDDPAGPVFASARHAIEDAARAEDNVVIEGPYEPALRLARRYAEVHGVDPVVLDAGSWPALDKVLSTNRPRMVILPLVEAAPLPRDLSVLAAWLETEIRFVTVVERQRMLSSLDPVVVAKLRGRTLAVWPRFEWIANRIVEQSRDFVPAARVHPTVSETLALGLLTFEEGAVDLALDHALDRLRQQGGDTLRGEDVERELYASFDPALCLHGNAAPRRRRARR